jgi:hypothetical protein
VTKHTEYAARGNQMRNSFDTVTGACPCQIRYIRCVIMIYILCIIASYISDTLAGGKLMV